MLSQTIRAFILDDNPGELNELHNKLGKICFPAVQIEFSAARYADEDWPLQDISGIRVCFVDISLLPAVSDRDNYAALAKTLEKIISKQNGPYILVAWTNDTTKFDGLKEYLNRNLPAELKPLDYAMIDKADAEQTQETLEGVINRHSDFRALLDWEKTVNISASNTLDTLYKVSSESEVDVNTILKGLGHSAIGHSNLANHTFMGVNEALLPILKDHQSHAEQNTSLWNALFANPSRKLALEEKAAISPSLNAKVFYEYKPSGVERKMPGALITVDYGWLKENVYSELPSELRHLLYKFAKHRDADSISNSQARIKQMLTSGELQIECCLLELSPCCDFAQNKSPRSKYIIGIKILGDRDFLAKLDINGSAIYQIPPVRMVPAEQFSTIMFSANYSLTSDANAFNTCTCIYRIREQLFTSIQTHYAQHVTRAGLTAIL